MTDIIDRLNDSLSAGYSELRKEAAVEIMRLRNAYYALLQERDNLHAKIEAMEEQKPMDSNYTELLDSAQKIVESYVYFRRDVAGTPLENDIAIWMVDFVLAQPAPSVPDVDALAQFIREVDGSHQLGAGVLAERIAEWLAAAPEAKP